MTKILSLVEEHDAEHVEVDSQLAFSVKREVLVEYLTRIMPVLPSKETIPGSSLVQLTTHHSTKSSLAYMSLYATNGEQQVLFDVDCHKVLVAGSVGVPGRKFLEVVKLSPKKWVHLQAVGSTLYVRSGNVRWSIQVDSAPKKVKFLKTETSYPVDIPRRAFLDALKIVLKSAPDNNSREALQQVQIKGGFATVCDGTRMHRKQIQEFPAKTDFNIQIPAAKLLIKGLSKSDSELISVEITKTAMLFDVGTEKFITQRSILPFPNVDQLLIAPAVRNEHTLSLDRSELIQSIHRVKVNSDPTSATVALTIQKTAKDTHEVKITARDFGGNSSEDTIPATWFGPEKFDTLYVHYRKFLDMLESTGDEFVFLKLGDAPSKGQKSPIYLHEPEDGLTVVLQQKQSTYM